MSTKKTIQINPELFKMPKTKKNREKKELTLNPIITPNNLKNKLLKRIKEHKSQEFKGIKDLKDPDSEIQSSEYTDEFYGALGYLSDLSKKQKSDALKQRLTKTLKNHQPNNQIDKTNISLELPPELKETHNEFVSNDILKLKVNEVPYGCLKNGQKKTYREWKELSHKIDVPDIIRPPTPPKKNVSSPEEIPVQSLKREEHLEQIKNKLKQIQNEENAKKQKILETYLDTSSKDISSLEEEDDDENDINIKEILKDKDKEKEKETAKTYLKKTLKRKFTLGKSDKLRRVSVLIKDNQTRKNIINTQKNLKKTSITDVRKYLRQHGMIKVGTTCPSDILRKVFESAVLTGEITNTNKETLLHNFLSSDPEE
jgi:hypothetical protein